MSRPAITRINGGFQVTANTTTNKKDNGILVPQLTTVQRDGIPNKVNGTIIQNTTTKTFEIYATYTITGGSGSASAWIPLGIPIMTDVESAAFEAANTIPGQMYFQTGVGNGELRVYNGGWQRIATA
jgi:expansin (peptidoglycan-binding protein)